MQLLLVLCAISFLIVVLFFWTPRSGDSYSETVRFPEAFRDAKLASTERLFKSSIFNGDWVVSARVDRACRSSSGLLALVELKTRAADKERRFQMRPMCS
jgi:hypothetical protein